MERISVLDPSIELTPLFELEQQLAKAEMDLAVMYMQFGLITGNIDEDPYHYQNLNVRSAEIAHQHKVCAELRLQIEHLAIR